MNNDVIVTEDYPFRKVAPELYTLDTLAISVSAGAVAALLVGFISGKNYLLPSSLLLPI